MYADEIEVDLGPNLARCERWPETCRDDGEGDGVFDVRFGGSRCLACSEPLCPACAAESVYCRACGNRPAACEGGCGLEFRSRGLIGCDNCNLWKCQACRRGGDEARCGSCVREQAEAAVRHDARVAG